MICKILGLFFVTLTADDKYSLLNGHNLWQDLQMQLSRKQKTLSQFFFAFRKSNFNFEKIQKKITLIADLFLNLGTPETVIR